MAELHYNLPGPKYAKMFCLQRSNEMHFTFLCLGHTEGKNIFFCVDYQSYQTLDLCLNLVASKVVKTMGTLTASES